MDRCSLYLNRHTSHDGPLMPLECLHGNLTYLCFTFAHKLLTSSMEHLFILSLDLDLKRQLLVISGAWAATKLQAFIT